jgi:hypothetical protein
MADTVLILMTLLILKHFIVDFPLQGPYQWMNKGTYLHPGGLLHAFMHGVATMLCFTWYAPQAAFWLGLFDAVIHYHVDWAKMNINAKFGWKADQHPQFWYLMGADQLAHYLTYIWLIYLVV